ncbi:MAG: ABC transporter ATP-binding protein [Acidobacteria bacterium]|nr:ABC transporter ATP-binding protein [Acidobacteriota bacterium]
MPGKDTSETAAPPKEAVPGKKRRISLVRLMLPHWKALSLGVLAALGSGLTDLLSPWPLKIVIDNVLGSKPMPAWLAPWTAAAFGSDRTGLLNFAALAVVGVALLGAVSGYVQSLSMTTAGQWVMHDLRSTLYHHIQRLSLSYHDRSQTGDLISRVTGDIETVQSFITSTLMDTVIDALTLIGMIAVMLYFDWRFTLIALTVAPFLFLFVYSYTHRIKKATRAVKKKEVEIVSKTQEVFSSIRVVKAFAREKYEKKRFKEVSMETVKMALRARALKAGLSPGVQLITAAGTALVLWYGARVVMEGALSLGDLTLFLAYLSKLYSPIRGLSKLPDSFSKPAIAFERIQEVMDVEIKSPGRLKPHKAPEFKGRIEFENVNFGYTPDRLILKDVNLTIEPGQIAAFVGPTGAGKTTIISLIPRFYEVTSGTIRIDGEDVRTLKTKSLRKQLGFVLQETLLFRAPVWQNIAYGKPSATREDIVEAAKLANAHEFIEQMSNGYDTMVGERGATLSGGQRQRIGIARAVIRDAPILILDEPTSGLDTASEAIVFDALHRLMAGRTCIVITHRLATIRNAHVIFVLKDGAIVERGDHGELLARGGLYQSLYETQFRKQEV